ncbi:hypothetical protein [Desulfonema magnum]|uniref:DUF2281 domain-containing protein n=1 Tax=Desulfonema magnum TaxID=45655 RepID=A0A975BMJ9_9BACT|nr:hypothetical protein [Desulfonema magnum]QTA88276.1 Uncharacterized protein dnm_043180 [Desulfonema magnum]
MQEQQALKAEIISSLDFLPTDSLRLLAEFTTFLQSKFGRANTQRQIVRLGGLWADTPEITAEDIAEARHEMWGKFGENEI